MVVRALILAGLMLGASRVSAEVDLTYDPIVLNTDNPGTFLLAGPAEADTALRLDRAIGEYGAPEVLVLSGDGGAALHALTLAWRVRALGLRTLVPAEGGCYAACALIFLAGAERIAEGELGVHGIGVPDADAAAGEASTSDVLDALEAFGTPDPLIVDMLRTPADRMYVLSEGEKLDYGFQAVPDPAAEEPPAGAEAAVDQPEPPADPAAEPVAPDDAPEPPAPEAPPEPPASDPPQEPPAPEVSEEPAASASPPESLTEAPAPDEAPAEARGGLEALAVGFITDYQTRWSGMGAGDVPGLAGLYPDQTVYFGRPTPRAAVLADKRNFAERWPERDYTPQAGTVSATCEGARCEVTGRVEWYTHSPARDATTRGLAAFRFVLVHEAGRFLILEEEGEVVERY